MFAPNSKNAPNIAIITLVSGWICTAFALLCVFLLVWSRRIGRGLKSHDYLLFVASAITVALTAHTSWAIIDEGLGRRQNDATATQRAALIKV